MAVRTMLWVVIDLTCLEIHQFFRWPLISDAGKDYKNGLELASDEIRRRRGCRILIKGLA
jgi:hypothetical protein